MTTKDGNGGAKKRVRRSFKTADGAKPESPDKGRIREIQDLIGYGVKPQAHGADLEGASILDPQDVQKFLLGKVTLGDLEGITKEEQYQMAQIGHGYLSSGKLDDAKTVFEGLLALDPYDSYFSTALGSIAHQQGDVESAERLYARALQTNPFSVIAYVNRGELRVADGRLAEGAADLLRAIQEDPDDRHAATQRARTTVMKLMEQTGETEPSKVVERLAKAEAARRKKRG